MHAQPNGVVIVTGASRGLGLGLACLLCAQNIPVVLTARSSPALQRVAAGLSRHGAVRVVAADAADEVAMQRAFELARDLGPLLGVVNNAGVIEPLGSIPDIEPAAFEAAVRTNVTGVLVGIRLALQFRSNGSPLRILNISSGAAVHAYAGWAAYCVSKAAVNMLTEVSAKEQPAQSGVSIMAVAPGIIETSMQRTLRTGPAFPEQRKFVALKESGSLLHAVEAAVALDWLLRFGGPELSGRMVDAREDTILREARQHGDSMGIALDHARRWYEELES